MSPTQYLFDMLVKEKFIFGFRESDDGSLQDIAFAHEKSIKLWEEYHYVMVMDTTYNTNM